MFNSIYFNGNEYREMWLNGNKIWEKDNGSEIVYPYPDADCVVTYANIKTSSNSVTQTFTVIDETLPYSINGEVGVNSYTFPYGETKVKLVNLKPMTFVMGSSTFFPTKIEQLRLPNLTDLSYLFYKFCFHPDYTYSWQPQYFEFNDSVTSTYDMFYDCYYLTDDMMAQLMPYFPNTSQVTNMKYMFYKCKSLTTLDLSFDTSKVTTMAWMFAYCESLANVTLSFNVSSLTDIPNLFRYCYALSSVDLSSWNTSTIESYSYSFSSVTGTTVHVGDGWTLGTESTFGSGTDLVFMRNGEVPTEVYGDIVVSTTDLYITEGITSSSLGVKLSQSPTNAQTVTYSYTSDYVTSWSNTFTFDSTNWNTYQYVAFTPALDGLYTDRTDTITFTSDNVTSVNCTIYVTNTEQENTGGGDTGDFPYSDADSVITYMNTSTSAKTNYFDIIDSSLPYSINGTKATSFSFPASSETQVKLVNLKPTTTASSSFFPVKIEQLRLPNLTDLSYLFAYFGYSSGYNYSWSPQYFEFNENVTDMSRMFYQCMYLTDELMAQLIPYLPNASNVTTMNRMFYQCKKLTKLDLSSWNTSSLTDTYYMFRYCSALKEIDLSLFNTGSVTSYSYMFGGVSNATIYIGDNWTLGTSATIGNGTNLTFVKGSSGGSSSGGNSGGTTTNSLLVDCSQSTAPTLPSYMTVDYNGTYSFSHGLYTTDVYGLIPSNKGKKSSTAYTRYKYVAPASGKLTFTYRCYAETNYDFMTVHVNTSTSQPSTTNATNQVFTTKGISSYQNTDGTASVSVVEGTTYYIHIQYYKDVSGDSGYDMGCIRKIELVTN